MHQKPQPININLSLCLCTPDADDDARGKKKKKTVGSMQNGIDSCKTVVTLNYKIGAH